METISVRDFRSNMASSFDRVAKGEELLIRRKNELYALVRIGKDDLTLSPTLQKRIDEVHEAYGKGECQTAGSVEDLENLLNAL